MALRISPRRSEERGGRQSEKSRIGLTYSNAAPKDAWGLISFVTRPVECGYVNMRTYYKMIWSIARISARMTSEELGARNSEVRNVSRRVASLLVRHSSLTHHSAFPI
jgi:hypothetical protein